VNDDDGSCYSGTGSGGSVWYSFQPQGNGPLDFTITPTGTTDYDFVLWDITAGCGNGQRQQVSCNYSLYSGNTGLSSINCNENIGNCSNNDCTTDSKGSDCNRFNRRPTVSSNRKYAVCINFYSGSNDGFTIQFKNESSSVNITDVTPPEIVNAAANACPSASQFTLLFSEYVDCSTIQATDFTLPGRTITLTPPNCVNNATNSVTITVSPPLTSGTFTLHAQDILDLCGNNMNSTFSIVIGSSPTANATSSGNICRSPGFLGIGYTYTPSSVNLTASGGSFYKWSDGQTGAQITVSPTATTNYTVTVTQGACPATATVTVNVEDAPSINIPDQTICAGESITLTASGGGTYQWYTNPSLFGNGTAINGATNASLTVSPTTTTTYRVIVTSPAGCKGQDDVKVTIVTSNCCNATIAPAGPFCTSDAPKTLTAGTSGGTWSGTGITNAATGEFSPAIAGAGTFKVYYTLNCGSVDSANIVVQTCTPLVVCKQTNGDLTASGGIAPYAWEKQTTTLDCSACPGGNCIPIICTGTNVTTWTSFGNTATITPPGTYPIRVRDGSGNIVTISSLASVTPCVNCPVITVSVQSKQDVTCANPNSGSATFSASGTTGNVTYTWSPATGSTTATANGLAAGTYNVTVRDANNCTGSGSVTIVAPASPTLTLSNPSNPSCGQNNGSVSATLSGGAAPYQVTIDNGQGNPQTQTVPIAGTAPISGLAAGSYTITVRDNNQCSAVQTLNLTPPNSPVINAASVVITKETCAGANDGSIQSATATGGSGNLQWSYAPAANPANTIPISAFPVTNIAPGNYILIVRDANNCTASQNFTVGNSANPCCNISLAISTTQPSCGQADGAITITPSPAGNYAYAWNNSLPPQAAQNNLTAGQYRVTVSQTANPSCNKDTVISLNPSNGPSIAFSNQVNPGCGQSNGSVNVTLSGGAAPYQVTIDNGQGNPQTQTVPIAGTAPVNGLAAGSYTISVVDFNNCSSVQTIVFTAPNPPVITSINATAETCAGDNDGSANVVVNGGNGNLSYAWSNGAGTASIGNLAPNTYTVTITDAANCSATGSATVTAGPVCCSWNISAAITQPACGANDGSINLTVLPSATYTYTWSNNVVTANNANLGAGIYRVTITNTNNGCVKDTSFSLSNANAPTIANVTATPESCNGADGTASVSATGGSGNLTITWSNGVSANSISGLVAGNYGFTVTDQAGCQATGSATVAAATNCCSLKAAASATATTCGNSNGSIDVTITTAGAAPYRFSLSGANYQSGSSFSGLSGGNYTVYVLDNNNCGDTLAVTVGSSTNSLALTFNTVEPGCAGANSGSVEAVVSGGNPTYSFAWSNASTANPITNLSAGSYTLTVTDGDGCTISQSTTLNAAQPFSISLGNDTAFCAGGNALLNAPSGFAQYLWSNGETTPSINVNSSNLYSLTVTNASGCTATASVAVTVNENPIVSLPNDTTMFENNFIKLSPVISGNNNGKYAWQPDDAISCTNCPNPVVNPQDTITYELTYTDNNKCVGIASIKVNVIKGGEIFIPNVFSPNGDGNNDILKPFGYNIKNISWKVFNRWGELVFVSNDFNFGWDGTFKGIAQPIGDYVYTMEVTFLNKTVKHYKGSLTLIR
jgi:gliding motility-associated-like protein